MAALALSMLTMGLTGDFRRGVDRFYWIEVVVVTVVGTVVGTVVVVGGGGSGSSSSGSNDFSR